MDRVSLVDLATIEAQIGRCPRGVQGVAYRCSYGYPQVIRVSPVVSDAPFPTLYWLTCPFLSREISRREADGWVGRLEARLSSDMALGAAMEEAHRRYVEQRNNLLTAEVRDRLASNGRLGALEDRGIGGLSDRSRLKCLHLHAAHELGDANPIGRIVLDSLSALECSTEKGFCSAL